jgi:bifunctional DNA-binding transcriptional regulator/antitoxin component of YhaV-PrlF toxin-antitoxin module
LLPICIRYRLGLNDEDKFAIDKPGDGPIILKKIGITTCFEKWMNEETFEAIETLAQIERNIRFNKRIFSSQPLTFVVDHAS